MKVLQINAVYGAGSTGRMTMEFHNYMNSIGIDSYIACSSGISLCDSHHISIGNPLDVKIHSLLSRLTGLQGYFSNKVTRGLLKEIGKIKPDIVQLGNLHSNFINVNMLFDYLAEQNIATVVVLHDCWFYTGKCTHYTSDRCQRWKEKCGDCPRLKKDIPSWFFDRTSTMIEDKSKCLGKINKLGVIGVSKWISEEARSSILKSSQIIRYIYNWIDTDTFYPDFDKSKDIREKYGLNGKKVILGVSNIWSAAKGLNTFIELSKLLDEDEIIILVGDVQGAKLPQNIINVPPTKNVEELVGFYTLATVFLQLSPEETFGKVVIEAMACGTPVIAVNSTANPELLTEKTGFVYQIGDIFDLKNKIDLINIDSMDYYQESCRHYAVNNFNLKKQMDKYIDFYKELLG